MMPADDVAGVGGGDMPLFLVQRLRESVDVVPLNCAPKTGPAEA